MATMVTILSWLYLHAVWLLVRRAHRRLPPKPGPDVQFHTLTFDVTLEPGAQDTITFWFEDNPSDPVDGFSTLSMVVVINDELLWVFGQEQAMARAAGDMALSRLRDRMEPHWVARVNLNMQAIGGDVRGDVLSCVGVAKRFLGVHDPTVQTTDQLLAYLWERRDK